MDSDALQSLNSSHVIYDNRTHLLKSSKQTILHACLSRVNTTVLQFLQPHKARQSQNDGPELSQYLVHTMCSFNHIDRSLGKYGELFLTLVQC